MLNKPGKNKRLVDKYMESMMKIIRSLHKISGFALNDSKITPLQMHAMHIIYETPDITVGELGDQLHMSSAAIAQLTNRLTKMNWISRSDDEKDRRIIRINITQKGKKEIKVIKSKVFDKMKDVMSILSEKDLKELVRINNKFITKLENFNTDEKSS